MTPEELKHKHPYHEEFGSDWELYNMIRKSGDDLVAYALKRHARESADNHDERVRDGVVFNLGKSVVEIFNFYLNQKETVYNIKELQDNPQWEMFLKDCDLRGTDYPALMIEARKWAAYFGSIGILVNKPYSAGRTIASEVSQGIYPYVSLYSLPNICDWAWAKDRLTHRMKLSFLKLYEGNDTWTIWTPERWAEWVLDPTTKQPRMVDSDENPLGEIPFTWLVNVRDLEHPELGVSDVVDISRIVVSMAQNLSSADEIIKYAGFPILRVPMKRVDLAGGDGGEDDDEVPVGESAVMEFDPSQGDAGKADWMPTQILEPIEAILKVIDRKEEEAYKISYLSGIRSQRTSGSGSGQSSGLALRYELSQLKSVLDAKSENSIEAQYRIVDYWFKWQGHTGPLEATSEIRQSREFNVDDLAVALENAIQSFGAVASKTFRERIQKKIAFTTLPDLSQDDKTKIESEIARNTPDKIELQTQVTNRAIVKPASKVSQGNQPKDGGMMQDQNGKEQE